MINNAAYIGEWKPKKKYNQIVLKLRRSCRGGSETIYCSMEYVVAFTDMCNSSDNDSVKAHLKATLDPT